MGSCPSYIVMTGFSNVRYGPFTLPLDIGFLTHYVGPYLYRYSGFLLTSIDFVDVVPASSSNTTKLSWLIPNDRCLVGMSFYQQTYMVVGGYPGIISHGLCTCAGHGVIGI